MADSKVQIEVTANTDDAKQKLAQLEAAADKAMDSGANSAKRFANGLDEVGKSAELSARPSGARRAEVPPTFRRGDLQRQRDGQGRDVPPVRLPVLCLDGRFRAFSRSRSVHREWNNGVG